MHTLHFEAGRLHLLDQRYLPLRTEQITCANAQETAEAIRAMVVRGAPAIGVAAAYGIALEALRLAEVADRARASGDKPVPLSHVNQMLDDACKVLLDSRPTAVNLRWAIERQQAVMQSLTGQPVDVLAQRLLACAISLHEDDIALNRRMGHHGAALLKDGARVLTHCNAGALATAGYGTALGVIRAARETGKRISVFADETRPFLQGARLTAWELMQDGIDVTLITDNMAGHLMAQGEVDAVIVGTDRVAANGDVVNKIGTYMVAVLAQRHGIPFYVACPLSTLDLRTPTGAEVPIEERSPDEVTGFAGVQWAPAGVRVRNPAFDVTPAELVSAIVTEAGVIHAPSQCDLAAWYAGVTAIPN